MARWRLSVRLLYCMARHPVCFMCNFNYTMNACFRLCHNYKKMIEIIIRSFQAA